MINLSQTHNKIKRVSNFKDLITDETPLVGFNRQTQSFDISFNKAELADEYNVRFGKTIRLEGGEITTQDLTLSLDPRIVRASNVMYCKVRGVTSEGVHGNWSQIGVGSYRGWLSWKNIMRCSTGFVNWKIYHLN